MPDNDLPTLEAGGRISAKWLNRLKWMCRDNRVTVARDCGLTVTSNPGGRVIGFTPVQTVWLGITTTSTLGRTSKTVHYGTVQPYILSGSTLKIHGPTVQVANWTGSVIATNIWVEYILMNKQYVFNGNDCSGVAP